MDPASPAPSGRAGRIYRSPRRARAAADTRATILAAAMRLFLERGYGGVTVSDIAREASIAVPTVYASTGGKSAILATLIDQAERDPVVEATFAAIRESRTPHDAMRATAHGVRVDNQRYHDLIQVMVTAATLDQTATATLVESDRRYRHALARTAHRLRELGALKPGMTLDQVTDILWFYLGHHAWRVLVADRRWSWDDAEAWLGEQASAALLDPER
jgi:AcrR family transcriptional regulator